jgi:alpha-glucosidase
VTARLDHLSWLGVGAIWLSPTSVSPDADLGYDVSDYRHVQPAFGGDAALAGLIAAAHRRGLRVLLDLVPNHTSVEHPWFVESRGSRRSPRRDWYVWADGRDGGPPNNWISDFGGTNHRSAWTHDQASGQWYLTSFLPQQVDLNWSCAAVRAEFLDILGDWFGRGVDGVRIDVAHKLAVDPELRDNPPLRDDDDPVSRMRGQRQVFNAERPEVHDILRSWRGLADARGRLLLGETFVADPERMARFYGDGDELHLALNIPFMLAALNAPAMRAVVAATLRALPAGAQPLWCGSSHDLPRLATRWAGGDDHLTRCALTLLLTLPGTPILYNGDEIGMVNVPVPPDRQRDAAAGRDPERTPMQWSAEPGGGFTRPGVEPWLPLGDCARRNVADQRQDPGSTLHLTRELIARRRAHPDLRRGPLEWLPAPPGVLAYRRGASLVVALNLGDAPARLGLPRARVLLATDGAAGGVVAGELELGPRRGVLAELFP